jgi:hypothetical protein
MTVSTTVQNDYTTLDFNSSLDQSVATDPHFTTIAGTNIAYKASSSDTPAGVWVVGNQKTTIVGVTLAKFYQGYLTSNNTIATQAAAMNVNAQFANAAAQFSAKLKSDANAMGPSDSKTYNDLISTAANYVSGLNMTAAQFVSLVLPKETSSSTYLSAAYLGLTNTVDQFANSKLTDNSVLQQKLDAANANRASIIDAISGITKAWSDFLVGLNRNI